MKAKRKGSRIEREVVERHKAAGVPANQTYVCGVLVVIARLNTNRLESGGELIVDGTELPKCLLTIGGRSFSKW